MLVCALVALGQLMLYSASHCSRLKYSSVYYSSSEVQWSVVHELKGLLCNSCFLYCGGGQLLVLLEHWWLTLVHVILNCESRLNCQKMWKFQTVQYQHEAAVASHTNSHRCTCIPHSHNISGSHSHCILLYLGASDSECVLT